MEADDDDDIIQKDLAASMAKIDIKSVMSSEKRVELANRFGVVKSSFLSRLSGKEFYVFSNTFTDQFLDVLSYIAPQTIEELFENELLKSLSELNTQFL